MHAQNQLFRRYAVGPFRSLLVGVAKDPAMIVWLESNANQKGKPNENSARERLEPFTTGPGPDTEQDVVDAARAFTGWHQRGGEFHFESDAHDTDTKTVLGETGDLDVVLRRPEAARFLARKLLVDFAFDAPEDAVVAALADRLLRAQYALRPVLRDLHGATPSLTDLYLNRNLKFTTDLRSVCATVLDRWLELPSEAIRGAKYEPLPFVRDAAVSPASEH